MDMKKFMFIGLAASALSVCAGDFAAGNMVGLMRVDSKAVRTVVAVPWIKCNGGDAQAIDVDSIVKTANLTAGDTINILDSGVGAGTFHSWILVDDEGVKKWESVLEVVKNGEVGESGDPTGAAVAQGGSFVLARQNPVDGSGNAIPFYLAGQVGTASSISQTIVLGTAEAPCYNLVAAPCSDAVNVISFLANANDGDVIRVMDSGIQFDYTYSAAESGWGYKKINPLQPWKGAVWTKVETIEVGRGNGFWYCSHGGAVAPVFTWNSGIPVVAE